MEKHMLTYYFLVLALLASAGLSWADSYVKTDTLSQVESVEILPNERIENIAELQGENDNESVALVAEIKNETNICLLFLPAILIVLLFISYGIYKLFTSKENKRLFIEEKKYKRVCGKIINNAISHDGLSIIGAIAILFLLMAVSTFLTLLLIRWRDSASFAEFSLSRLGSIGDFSGGVIGTIIALIVAIYAIRTYRLERQQQREASVSAMLSTMLDLHRKNVEDIKIIKTGTTSNMLKGREAFEQLYNELKDIFAYVIDAIQTEVERDREKYADWVDETKQKKLAHILSYGYFFYSVDSYMIPKENDDANLYQICEKAASAVPDEYRNLYRHNLLGHYYRHLYNMVNYIEKNEFSHKYEKKEPYVKLIRSQLSDYEQILLYYDTLSLLGKDWNEPLGREEISEMNMICKYRLLKNCPNYMYYFGRKPSETYSKEKKVWDKKKDYFFETDSKGQQESLKKMLSD